MVKVIIFEGGAIPDERDIQEIPEWNKEELLKILAEKDQEGWLDDEVDLDENQKSMRETFEMIGKNFATIVKCPVEGGVYNIIRYE